MAVIQKDIVVPDYLLPKILDGTINIMGLAKSSDNGRIIKHLDVFDPNDNSNSKVLTTVLITAGLAAVAGVSYGIYAWISKSKVEHFKKSLNAYVEAVNEKRLTVGIIDDLVKALDNLKGGLRDKIKIDFTSKELTALVDCLCNHTQTLADANNINIQFETTEEEKADILLRLRNNLVKQRGIFVLAA